MRFQKRRQNNPSNNDSVGRELHRRARSIQYSLLALRFAMIPGNAEVIPATLCQLANHFTVLIGDRKLTHCAPTTVDHDDVFVTSHVDQIPAHQDQYSEDPSFVLFIQRARSSTNWRPVSQVPSTASWGNSGHGPSAGRTPALRSIDLATDDT